MVPSVAHRNGLMASCTIRNRKVIAVVDRKGDGRWEGWVGWAAERGFFIARRCFDFLQLNFPFVADTMSLDAASRGCWFGRLLTFVVSEIGDQTVVAVVNREFVAVLLPRVCGTFQQRFRRGICPAVMAAGLIGRIDSCLKMSSSCPPRSLVKLTFSDCPYW